MNINRRRLLAGVGGLGVGIVMSGCSGSWGKAGAEKAERTGGRKDEMEVGAVEDLMREHGVLRRVLFVYSETARRLRRGSAPVSAGAINKAATLFRDFGEEYHETMLEEAHIFPAVRAAGGEASQYVRILNSQHARGRQITEYILGVTQQGEIAASSGTQLARAMDTMVRMYRPHAAREDTIVFPAWKAVLTAGQLREMSEEFEDIEHEQFGEDGFETAVSQISLIEKELGLADLAQFTAPVPPAK